MDIDAAVGGEKVAEKDEAFAEEFEASACLRDWKTLRVA
jgi:hypothetical protein